MKRIKRIKDDNPSFKLKFKDKKCDLLNSRFVALVENLAIKVYGNRDFAL